MRVPTPRTSLPEPMYATLGHSLPRGGGWTFEPKYDGMRVLAEASAKRVRLVTRNGKDKSGQFPELVLGLRELAARAGRILLLDGEVVARAKRRRGGVAAVGSEFQRLQSRMHLKDPDEILRLAIEAPTSLAVFDFLRDGRASLLTRAWRERRDRLEALFDEAGDPDDASSCSATTPPGAPRC